MSTPVPLIPVWRSYVVVLSCLLTATVYCQKTPERDYLLHFGAAITQVQEKYLHEGLTDQDPGVEVWVDAPTNTALVRIHDHLDRETLQIAVQASGLVIASVVEVLTAQPDVVIGPASPQPHPPVDQEQR